MQTRTCVICESAFTVDSKWSTRAACSNECTNAKRSASLLAFRSIPENNERVNAAAAAATARWHQNPANAAKFAKRQSDRMKRLHTDPDFQARRDIRSAKTMKRTWEQRREQFMEESAKRYAHMAKTGTGICSTDSIERKNAASKWIMKRAQDALHSETNYDEVYADVQARLRREMPYDGPQDGSEYLDYCAKLGRAVVNSPECRTIADTFMSKAIPHAAEHYRHRTKEMAC